MPAHQLADTLLHELLARELGPVLIRSLTDRGVVEILVNPDRSIWEDRFGQGLTRLPEQADPLALEALTSTIASLRETTFTDANPELSTFLDIEGIGRCRFTAARPPLVESVTISIRKHDASHVYRLGPDFKDKGFISARHGELLAKAINERSNIIVCGGPGAGKTALANALLLEIADPTARILLLEDVPELHCPGLHTVALRKSPTHTLEDLLRLTVRLRPSRICLGELRGSETLTLLSAWNTDTRGGIATIHANTSRSALDRLELFVRLASNSVAEVARTLIGQAVHLVVSVHRGERGPQVAELLRVEGYDSRTGEYRLAYESIE
jgi:type IV secretion system protein VirB11